MVGRGADWWACEVLAVDGLSSGGGGWWVSQLRDCVWPNEWVMGRWVVGWNSDEMVSGRMKQWWDGEWLDETVMRWWVVGWNSDEMVSGWMNQWWDGEWLDETVMRWWVVGWNSDEMVSGWFDQWWDCEWLAVSVVRCAGWVRRGLVPGGLVGAWWVGEVGRSGVT
jgi:hypothetical protein